MMGKASPKSSKHQIFLAFAMVSTLVASIGLLTLFFMFFYQKIYPGVHVLNTHIGGLTQEEALTKLKESITLPSDIKINEFTLPLAAIEAEIDYAETMRKAYSVGRTGIWHKDLFTILSVFVNPTEIKLAVKYNPQKLSEQAKLISSQTPTPPEYPKLTLSGSQIRFTQGSPGLILKADNLEKAIVEGLEKAEAKIAFAPIKVDPTLTAEEEKAFIARGELLKDKSLELSTDNYSVIYRKQALLDLLSPTGYTFERQSPTLAQIAEAVRTPPQNPVFRFKEGKVEEFSPARDGLEANTSLLENEIKKALTELENSELNTISVPIPVKRTPPEFATEDVNELGIKELIGVGTSTFRGSIASRVYNISLAASRLNGVLIKPGETFSFVNTLGDISALTGYQQAYIIQGNQTILGDGGGVCQVSTTFFRAALNAGLPIVERHPHSYRVSYYEQDSPPGIDATIYHPTVDIKIKNDTPGHILIQTFTDTKNMTLRFELYGTSDGRTATISKPVVSSVIPPPEDLYIDDPTLPSGEIKQVDYKAWGAKVNFNYKVERSGQVIFEETYYSNYRPWQAKFLRGTGPIN